MTRPQLHCHDHAPARYHMRLALGSGTGKTAVCTELRRRGYQAIHGDWELAYRGDPETGQPTATFTHAHPATFTYALYIQEHHIWDVEKVNALVANQDEAVTFFCGGSRNFSKFIKIRGNSRQDQSSPLLIAADESRSR